MFAKREIANDALGLDKSRAEQQPKAVVEGLLAEQALCERRPQPAGQSLP
jgi:hypothetical protein